jgi:hypothetical protein
MSTRSHRLWIAVLTVGVAGWGAQLIFDAREALPVWLGALIGCVWILLFLTYFASRLSDSSAHERRTARRRTYSPQQ